MVIKFGFTGSRQGMTDIQKQSFSCVIFPYAKYNELVFIHGDCIGCDKDAHDIVRGYKDSYIIIHPPINKKYRAYCDGDIILESKDYIPRNHDIVYDSDIIIACPNTLLESLRSGTWATVRHARKLKKKIIIIYPDGRVE